MPKLNESDLYNLGLGVFNTLDDDMLESEDIMDSDTVELYNTLCKANKNFENDLKLAVKYAQSEYEDAMSINGNDYTDPNDFFEAKKDAEEKVLEKLTDKMSAYLA